MGAASETVRNVLGKPMPIEQKAAVADVLGAVGEDEDNLLTMAVTGMVVAASEGNVSAFNALMELYGEDAAKQAAPKEASVLQLVIDDRKAKAAK